MKSILKLSILSILMLTYCISAKAQTVKTPGSCKMYLDDKVVTEISVEAAIKWAEMEPPTVLCDDGKIYKLESFQISFLTLKPFMNQDFGVGLNGFPILARKAIANGKTGDTIILKKVTYTDEAGNKNELPIISLKIQ